MNQIGKHLKNTKSNSIKPTQQRKKGHIEKKYIKQRYKSIHLFVMKNSIFPSINLQISQLKKKKKEMGLKDKNHNHIRRAIKKRLK